MIWKICLYVCLAYAVNAHITDEELKPLTDILTASCIQNGAADKVTEVTAAGRTFVECSVSLIDTASFTIEMQAVRRNPYLIIEEVVKKYCDKSAQVKNCLDSYLEGTKPCMKESERAHIAQAKNASNELIDFMCFNDAQRVSWFLHEGGPQCVMEKRDSIQACLMKLMEEIPNADYAKNMSAAETCDKYDQLSSCVITNLRQCSSIPPAKLAESIFKISRKQLDC